MQRILLALFVLVAAPVGLAAQHHHPSSPAVITNVEPQPLLAQALRVKEALQFLGSPLPSFGEKSLTALQKQTLSAATSEKIQQLFDPYCLVVVKINPESRVSVENGRALPSLTQNGWSCFLVKVINEAGISAALQVKSQSAQRPFHYSDQSSRVDASQALTRGESESRFLDLEIYHDRPMLPSLSGSRVEYQILQVYSKDAGVREAEISFDVGQGSQDIGFRNNVTVLFKVRKAVMVTLHIHDDNGSPAMASLSITDSIARIDGKLPGYYPLPARRVAAFDEYPDFFFQKQIYRNDGETVSLPPGRYHIRYTRGPEYIPQLLDVDVPANKDAISIDLRLKRWIDLKHQGWYSADSHVHGAGCSHYDSPEEGVPPAFMMRQALGEDLNVAAVLAWGPSWYHQKNYFTGKDDSHSSPNNIMRYDVEVSGFPSSHAGHIVLLRLKEDDYPGTTRIEQWPSWTLPILQWAKSQGGLVGYAHSGWGLEPVSPTTDLPNYVMPKMDNIGANEYIVTITQNAVDFYSLGDTPPQWELNMWYHTLNCGFRPRISGETDFPCITDQRVGMSRSYFKSDSTITYDAYIDALKKGSSYVSEGGSHILGFAVNGQEVGTHGSELNVKSGEQVTATAKVAAYLPLEVPDSTAMINERNNIFWNIEYARKGRSRQVMVELIVNGFPVDSTLITADGKLNSVSFRYRLPRSAWMAMRVLRSSHSNPVFVLADGKPIHELRSAEWCRKAVDQCWGQKQANMRPEDRQQAAIAYDKARAIYDKIIAESK